MKKIIIPFLSLILPVAAICQEHSVHAFCGRIDYIEKIKLELKLEGDAARFADQIPDEQENQKVLYFNSDCSLYESNEPVQEEKISDHNSAVMKVRVMNGGMNDKLFSDLKEKKSLDQKEFLTRQFLVEGDLLASDWKITDTYRKILGYNCQEAEHRDSTGITKAWFTSAIPVSTGPAGFNGLPGMILQIEMNNGKRKITASSIDLQWQDNKVLVRPTEGKKVTNEEFKKIVDEKMKEMGVEGGNGTKHVIVRYKNN